MFLDCFQNALNFFGIKIDFKMDLDFRIIFKIDLDLWDCGGKEITIL